LFERKFDFSRLATKTGLNKKIDFIIDNIIGKDTNSIHFYTKLDSYYDLMKIRKDYGKIYSIIDTAEINSNFHFIDFNFDSKLDCIYDRLNPADDNLQFIFLFINNNHRFEKLRIRGYFVTKYYTQNNKAVFETFSWACCEESFNHYSISELSNDKIIERTHILIPRKLFYRHLNGVNKIHTVKADNNLFAGSGINIPLKELSEPILISKGQRVKVLDSIDETNFSWELVEVDIKSRLSNAQITKIIGWIKVER
jgi:hypothetical protein